MSLQAKLDAFKSDFEAGKPPYNVPRAVIETMHRATTELIESGAAQRAKKEAEDALANRTEAVEVAEAQAKLAQALAQLQALERMRKNLKH